MTSPNKDQKTPIEYVTGLIGTGSDVQNQYYKEAGILLQEVKEERDYKTLLKQPGVPLKTVKLYILGHGGTGKSTLMNSLSANTGVVPSFLRKLKSQAGPVPGTEVHEKTPGISINDLKISGKQFNTWDFAADSTETGHIIRPNELKELSLAQTSKWSMMMKATNKSCLPDDLKSRLSVILVASKADWAKIENCEEEARRVAEEIKMELTKLFGKYLDIEDIILILDCHDPDSAGMKKLRKILKIKRIEKIEKIKYMPNICAEILKMLGTWFQERIMFPVMYWNEYIECIKQQINSTLEDDFLVIATEFLHRIGMVLYMKCRTSPEGQDIVILAPKWFCDEILGPIFASKKFDRYPKHLKRKQIYTKKDIQQVLEGNVVVDVDLLVNLLQNVFPQLQTRLHVHFTALGRPPSGIWKDGIKICKGVEGLVQLSSNGRAVNVVVRCESKQEIGDCFEVLEMVSYDIQQVLHSACPGTEVDRYVLSAESLRSNEKLEDVCYYTLDEIREAENKKTNVYHKTAGKEEKVTDLIMPGFDTTFLKEQGMKCDVKWLPHKTRQTVIKHLEPEDPMWQDHRIMAQHMGIGHDDRKLFAAQAKTRGTDVTELFLSEWSARWEEKVRREGDKVVKYVKKKGVFYESSIENLLKINNEFLHHHDVTCALESVFKKDE
ncbi:death-associated protein kinase 1-like [Saccoglossus kowalevskii]